LFEPGEGWHYGSGIDWAGKIIERVSGDRRLGDYFEKHIFEPLGMKSTGFRLAESGIIRDKLCSTTARTPAGDLVAATPYPNPDPKDDTGGGGLYSSGPDYLKVLVSLLRNDGVLLKPETVHEMFTPQLQDPKHLIHTATEGLGAAMYRGGVDNKAWNFGLGGILNTEDVEGLCKKDTMAWGGLPNLFWV
jgi:CubicO group peptidase (beta-lactamase class C family)